MIDIIIPVYNNLIYTKMFLDSLQKQSFKDFNLIIIDNASEDETPNFLAELQFPFPFRIISNEKNLWYVKAVNQGISLSKAPFIYLGNNDTILPTNLLENLMAHGQSYWILSVLTNALNKWNENPLLIDYDWDAELKQINLFSQKLQNNPLSILSVDFVFWHCMFIDRKVIEIIWCLDERFWIGNYDDQDFCKRAKLAWFQVGLLQNEFIYHFCHATFQSLWINVNDLLDRNFTLFQWKWK